LRCALKLESGTHEGLGASWRRGTAVLTPRCIAFKGTRLEVLSLSQDSRAPELGDGTRVGADAVVYTVVTPSARVLWAVPSDAAGWALKRLAVSVQA
jgi:hypothetical protein